MPKVATARPALVKRSSGSRVRLPTIVTVLSAISSAFRRLRRVSGRRAGFDHAAPGGFAVGQADQLVANDIVREAQVALELVQRAAIGEHVEEDVVALFLAVDRVGEASLPPPV